MNDRIKALEDALRNIRELNETGADENGHRWANSDLIEQEIVFALAASQPAQPVAWVEKQELEYLRMVTGNKGWSGYQRVIMVGGEKEGCAPLYAAPQPLTVQDAARVLMRTLGRSSIDAAFSALPPDAYGTIAEGEMERVLLAALRAIAEGRA